MKASDSKPTLHSWAQRERATVGIAPWWASALDALSEPDLDDRAREELIEVANFVVERQF